MECLARYFTEKILQSFNEVCFCSSVREPVFTDFSIAWNPNWYIDFKIDFSVNVMRITYQIESQFLGVLWCEIVRRVFDDVISYRVNSHKWISWQSWLWKKLLKLVKIKTKNLNKKLLYKTFIKSHARKVLLSKNYVKKIEPINTELF